MPKDPRNSFSCSMHLSAIKAINAVINKIVKNYNAEVKRDMPPQRSKTDEKAYLRKHTIKRGAIIERMLLESIKKED